MSDKIILEDVTVAFSTSNGVHHALSNLNYEFRRADWTAVIGANGSGKSTLSKVLAGLCSLSKGRVTLPDAHTDASAPTTFSPVVQLVLQNPEAQIVGQTVYEDICFGLENIALRADQMKQVALEALRRVGLDVPLEMSVESLSGGQKQLLAIAGCLAMKPSVLIFDEVTSMLNPEIRKVVLRAVKNLHLEGMTVIWITQWLDELSYANKVVALEHGKITFSGTPREFFYNHHEGESHCDQFGFTAPYIVQVVRELEYLGVTLPSRPLNPEELELALEELCLSV